MRAVGLYRYLPIEHPDSLVDVELPAPTPSGRDVLVEVKAISVNLGDYRTRAPKDLVETSPKILGWDVAGLSFAEAAALPLTLLTAWEGLFERMAISKRGDDAGKILLIIGGAGGVDQYFPAFASLIKPQGRIGAIVSTQKPVEIAPLMGKSVTFAGELMFTRPTFQTDDMQAQHDILNEAAALVEAGTLRTTMTANLGRISAPNVQRAHALLEGGHVIGKLVLEGFS